MGVYLNPNNYQFKKICNSEIYVDKTEMITLTNRILNTQQNCICISRPRRFGKSMAAYMLAAYYGKGCDSSELFAPYKIAQKEDYQKHLNQYNVIMLNIQNFLSITEYSVNAMITYLQKEVIEELDKAFPGKMLKDKTYVALAYMTGILPVKKYGTHSALNMFTEYSMTNSGKYAEFIGFTEEEVKTLCKKYEVDFETVKNWYDGYMFPKASHIYNPKSVVNSILSEEFESYWTQTETYEALKIYIDLNYDGLKDAIVQMLGGDRVTVNTKRFQNDMTTFHSKDDVLTLLIHLGYLAFDRERSEVFIPNYEIRGEFCNAIEGEQWKDVIDALEQSDRLLSATWQKDGETVAEILDAVHSQNTSILTYNDENSLSCVISLAYYNAMKEYTKIREFPTGCKTSGGRLFCTDRSGTETGLAEIVYLPKRHSDKPAMIIELKYDQSTEGALAQMKEKKYMESLKEYHGNLLLVGINYDKESKKHTCVIEQWEK